jgi:hypothetical protein
MLLFQKHWLVPEKRIFFSNKNHFWFQNKNIFSTLTALDECSGSNPRIQLFPPPKWGDRVIGGGYSLRMNYWVWWNWECEKGPIGWALQAEFNRFFWNSSDFFYSIQYPTAWIVYDLLLRRIQEIWSKYSISGWCSSCFLVPFVFKRTCRDKKDSKTSLSVKILKFLCRAIVFWSIFSASGRFIEDYPRELMWQEKNWSQIGKTSLKRTNQTVRPFEALFEYNAQAPSLRNIRYFQGKNVAFPIRIAKNGATAHFFKTYFLNLFSSKF